jgi:hypothetical protein
MKDKGIMQWKAVMLIVMGRQKAKWTVKKLAD